MSNLIHIWGCLQMRMRNTFIHSLIGWWLGLMTSNLFQPKWSCKSVVVIFPLESRLFTEKGVCIWGRCSSLKKQWRCVSETGHMSTPKLWFPCTIPVTLSGTWGFHFLLQSFQSFKGMGSSHPSHPPSHEIPKSSFGQLYFTKLFLETCPKGCWQSSDSSDVLVWFK